MTLTLTNVLLVIFTAGAAGVGLGVGAALVFLSALSFMRYAAEYADRINAAKKDQN